MANERIGFIMPRSVTEAMECFPADQQLAAYQAINRYGLDGVEPEFDDEHQVARGIFILAKPFLDANNRRYENGRKGGRPITETKPNRNQTEPNNNQTITETKPNRNQTEPNRNQTVTETKPSANQIVEKKNSRRVEELKSGRVEELKSKEGAPPISPRRSVNAVPEASQEDLMAVGVPPALCEQVSEWVSNRDAKGETLTQGEFKSFVSMVNTKAAQYGAKAVSDVIGEAMSNGYKGVPWDRLERRARDKPANTFLQDLMEAEV